MDDRTKPNNIGNGVDVANGLPDPKKIDADLADATKVKVSHGPTVPAPPDGGWGWVVTFAAFMTGIVIDGICFTFGFFLNDFQTYFNANKSMTSTISSVLNGSYMVVAPIAGALVNVFGCRRVAMVGSIITTVSFFMSTFSPNVEVMILVYGVCGGIGFGLMYLPAIVMVGYYFEKRRALATGIAVCGSGIGGFVFSPLCEYLISAYSWKGAMWIISGLVLNGVVFSCVFRPLEYPSDRSAHGSDCGEDVCKDDTTTCKMPLYKEAMEELRNSSNPPIYRCKSLDIPCKKDIDNNTELARLGHSMFLDIEPRSRKHALGSKHVINPFDRNDIFYTGSIQHLPEYSAPGGEDECTGSLLSLSRSDSTTYTCSLSSCDRIFTNMFDLSLLKSPTFVIYGLSCFLCMLGFFVPFVYLPGIVKGYGMSSSQTAWVISTIGIINTVGRLAVGWVSDKKWSDCILINTVSLVIAGVATMFVPYIKFYPLILVYALVFGFGIAAFVSLRSIIIVELMGIDKLTNSFGLVVLCQGLSTFIGSPIAGALYDATGDFQASFYLAGTVIAMSGVICLPLRRMRRWELERTISQSGYLDDVQVDTASASISRTASTMQKVKQVTLSKPASTMQKLKQPFLKKDKPLQNS